MGMKIINGMPVAVVTDQATGNIIAGPGDPTCLEMGMPAACMGDAVAGPTCIGAVTMTSAATFIYNGRPRAVTTGLAAGSNPAAFGIPITLPVIGTGK